MTEATNANMSEVTKAAVATEPTNLEQIKALLEVIINLKRQIPLAKYDESLSFQERTETLEQLQTLLRQGEHLVCCLMSDEICVVDYLAQQDEHGGSHDEETGRA